LREREKNWKEIEDKFAMNIKMGFTIIIVLKQQKVKNQTVIFRRKNRFLFEQSNPWKKNGAKFSISDGIVHL
jgi:hypothetical protein